MSRIIISCLFSGTANHSLKYSSSTGRQGSLQVYVQPFLGIVVHSSKSLRLRLVQCSRPSNLYCFQFQPRWRASRGVSGIDPQTLWDPLASTPVTRLHAPPDLLYRVYGILLTLNLGNSTPIKERV